MSEKSGPFPSVLSVFLGIVAIISLCLVASYLGYVIASEPTEPETVTLLTDGCDTIVLQSEKPDLGVRIWIKDCGTGTNETRAAIEAILSLTNQTNLELTEAA